MMIDGLQCGYFTREVFSTLREGGFTCVTSTLGFWEGAIESLDSLGKWRAKLGDINSFEAEELRRNKTDDDLPYTHGVRMILKRGHDLLQVLRVLIREPKLETV